MGIFDFGKKKDKLDKDDWKWLKQFHSDVLTAQQITNQAISFRNLKQYDKAISLLKKAINEYHDPQAKSVLGNTLAMKGDIDAAEAHFKKMLSDCIKKDDYFLVEIYANLGSLYHNYRKDDNTALKYYQLALDVPKPKEDNATYDLMVANVYRDLCVIHFHIENIHLAKQYAFKRLQTVKDCPTAARVYGCCLFFKVTQEGINIDKNERDTDLESIVKYLQIAITEDPDNFDIVAYITSAIASAFFYMSQIAFYQNNPTLINSIKQSEKEYIQRLEKCSKQSESAKIFLKSYQDNVNSFLAGRYHEDAETWYKKGNALSELGKYQEAIVCYDKAIEINPIYDAAWYSKGAVLVRLGKDQEAIVCFDKALEIDPRYDTWYSKGAVLSKLGKYQEAVYCFDKALALNPRYAKAWNDKGVSLLDLGRPQEAIACYDKAIEINPREYKAWFYKGYVEDILNKTQAAITSYKQFLES